MPDKLTDIPEGVIRVLPDGGGEIRASVYDLDYAAYPNLRTEEVELEPGTVVFGHVEVWLVANSKRSLLLNLSGVDAKTFQTSRAINESSVENWGTTSALIDWIEDEILDYEREKYSEADYQMMRDEEAGDRAYHDRIDA